MMCIGNTPVDLKAMSILGKRGGKKQKEKISKEKLSEWGKLGAAAKKKKDKPKTDLPPKQSDHPILSSQLGVI